MTTINRRAFLKTVGLGGIATATGFGYAAQGAPTGTLASAHVIVVGGGTGGATAAKYIKRFAPDMRVTLIEPSATYYTCYGSNWVLGGIAQMEDIAQTYGALSSRHGVNVVQDTVTEIDPAKRTVKTAAGAVMNYDRLVLSPGIDFRYDTVAGITAADAQSVPHAWKAGEQTLLLRNQLEAMPDGGVFVLVAPSNPYRCPPGPYERVSMVAHYFKTHKPRSKIIVLDNKEAFAKQGLFLAGWKQHYGDMIEWVPSTKGGQVEEIKVAERVAVSDGGMTTFKADVLNYVPPQTAGAIAVQTGLNGDGFWCPVDQRTFESAYDPHIHVIGDASVAGAMPKAGHAANSQGKLVAAAIVRTLSGLDPLEPVTASTCYSLITPEHGVSITGVYEVNESGAIAMVEGAGGVSPAEAPEEVRKQEAQYTRNWYAGITQDIWA
jgi:sulfide dehydrogenase [flavocytochrome c] flavoprotein subunit